jgi:hypothetical protein
MADFAAPSFHDGSGSVCAGACAANNNAPAKARILGPTSKQLSFIAVFLTRNGSGKSGQLFRAARLRHRLSTG